MAASKLLRKVVHKPVDKILPAETVVASSALYFEYSSLNEEQRHVQRPTAEIKDEHPSLSVLHQLLVQAVSHGRCSRLVDDPEHVQARDRGRVLGGLPLSARKVRRNRDDGVRHRAAEVGLGKLLHFAEDHGRDLLRQEEFGLSRMHHLDRRAAAPINKLKRPQLRGILEARVVVWQAEHPFRVIHRVLRAARVWR